MKVVVTGAGGFVGARVALAFARNGHAVTACYRNGLDRSLAVTSGIVLVQGDLADGVALPARFDVLVHCAADIPGLCSDATRLTRSNVTGAARVFEAALAAGVRTIVNLSSMSAYGRISVPEVREDLAPDHPDPYGQSKLAAERLLQALCGTVPDLAALSIRLPGVVGRGSHHNFLSGVMAAILADAPVRATNPDALFNNIVYVDDLARFIVAWTGRTAPGHVVTNIAASDPLPIRDVIGDLYAHVGRTPRVTWETGGKLPFLISLDRVRSLGYAPPTVRDCLKSFADDVLLDHDRRA